MRVTNLRESRFTMTSAFGEPDYEVAVEMALQAKGLFGDTLVNEVIAQYGKRLSLTGFHSPLHWERVLINGMLLKQMLPDHVCSKSMFLFALFHDSRREDEGVDILHGMRGASYFRQMLEQGKIPNLAFHSAKEKERVIEIVESACDHHSTVLFSEEPEIAACFDADRLDLGRVSIYPDLAKLNFSNAISEQLISDCTLRAHVKADKPIFRSKKSDEEE